MLHLSGNLKGKGLLCTRSPIDIWFTLIKFEWYYFSVSKFNDKLLLSLLISINSVK